MLFRLKKEALVPLIGWMRSFVRVSTLKRAAKKISRNVSKGNEQLRNFQKPIEDKYPKTQRAEDKDSI